LLWTARMALRWAWATLTSMRTALILLFLLAVAAVPGSVLPQRRSDPLRVAGYLRAHGKLGSFLDWLGGFDVYGSVWFSAIYLLLFISLTGCVIPRSLRHLQALRASPPPAPRRLSRLPMSGSWSSGQTPEQALDAAGHALRGRRFRVTTSADSVNAENGYLRESGNLLFHLSLLGILAGIASGALLGFTGTVLVKDGEGFSDTPSQYDGFSPGRMLDTQHLPPFGFTLKSFNASYVTDGATRGAASSFDARVTFQSSPSASARPVDIRVNHPLGAGGANIYLVGHGYAPTFVVRDGSGKEVFNDAVAFLPQDGAFTSTGVVKVPDASPSQLGFSGLFLPTAYLDPKRGPISVFPAADNPVVVLVGYAGDLGLNSGIPQSVYSLDTARLVAKKSAVLTPGQTLTLPNSLGSITFTGYKQWATFQITKDPGKPIVGVAVVLMAVGLLATLTVRRRRIWVRADRDETGRTRVAVGGLTRGESSDRIATEFDALVTALRDATADPFAADDRVTAGARPSEWENP
jgi:cytochrome c biogenesis protein